MRKATESVNSFIGSNHLLRPIENDTQYDEVAAFLDEVLEYLTTAYEDIMANDDPKIIKLKKRNIVLCDEVVDDLSKL